MTVLIAIAGLGFLILIHEAGHFFTALAVGMRPRRFYVGFPPALVKTKRGGVEYGIGAIPLGGYVKIPGMHRPAPSDLDVHFGSALYEAPQLLQPIERVKRPLAEGEFDSARAALKELRAALAETQLSSSARRQANRGLTELDDALGPDAYWRQRTWRKLAVIAAGPLTNLVFAILLLAVVYIIGIPSAASRRVESVDSNTPAAKIGLKPGDVIVEINQRQTSTFDDPRKRRTAARGLGSQGRQEEVAPGSQAAQGINRLRARLPSHDHPVQALRPVGGSAPGERGRLGRDEDDGQLARPRHVPGEPETDLDAGGDRAHV